MKGKSGFDKFNEFHDSTILLIKIMGGIIGIGVLLLLLLAAIAVPESRPLSIPLLGALILGFFSHKKDDADTDADNSHNNDDPA